MPIGNLRESSLHAALKTWYARPGDEVEAQVAGYFIDLRRGDTLIEIQTRNFSALKRKLTRLLDDYAVRLVHPIAQEKYLVRQTKAGRVLSRRKSPKHGLAVRLFDELVSVPDLAAHPRFVLEIVLTREEEISREGRGGSWRRRGWKIVDRRLLDVLGRAEFTAPRDYAAFLPANLPETFTTRDLAEQGGYPLYLAQKMAYCLRRMDVLAAVGKRRNAALYARVDPVDLAGL
jgi:hypothetical protein